MNEYPFHNNEPALDTMIRILHIDSEQRQLMRLRKLLKITGEANRPMYAPKLIIARDLRFIANRKDK